MPRPMHTPTFESSRRCMSPRDSGNVSVCRFFRLDEGREPFANLLRDGHGIEVALADADEDVLATGDGADGIGLAADLEVQVDRGPADPGEVSLDDQELIQLHRLVEIAFHAHARKPEVQRLEEVLVSQSRRAK